MRKVIYTILVVLAFAFILPACSTSESLEETMEEIETQKSFMTDDDRKSRPKNNTL